MNLRDNTQTHAEAQSMRLCLVAGRKYIDIIMRRNHGRKASWRWRPVSAVWQKRPSPQIMCRSNDADVPPHQGGCLRDPYGGGFNIERTI